MVEKKKERQISEYIGKQVSVFTKTGIRYHGVLTYFNFDNNTVHMRDARLVGAKEQTSAEFCIINGHEWINVMVE